MTEPSPSQQNELIAAFKDGRVDGIQLSTPVIKTHVSLICLTGTHAYKLKRNVHLPFVDFSSLAKREAGCRAELDINQKLAGAMYESVQPITKAGDGRFQIGGQGDLVDWCVVMKRFQPGCQFDELARSGRLDRSLLEATADTIANAHSDATIALTAGHATDYRGVIRELKETEREGAEQLGLSLANTPLFEALDRELVHLDHLIENRRRAGKVRRTHGDLHLRNMCLFNGKPTLFDALEFDDRLATTDLLYDLAYLLMDLRRIDRTDAANLILNRYWDRQQEDETALCLLPFFASLRATVRMAVDVQAGFLEEAVAYRNAALAYLSPIKPVCLAIGGLSGTGKSTVARALAPHLPGTFGARWLRSDVLRKTPDDIHTSLDTTAYSQDARSSVYDTLFDHGSDAFKAGQSVILDATFQDAGKRTGFGQSFAKQNSIGIWLTAPLDTRLTRIAGRSNDPSDATPAVAAAQTEPSSLPPDWIEVDASGPIDRIVDEIIQRITLS